MSLTLAFTNDSATFGRRYPDGHTLMRRKTLTLTAKAFRVGSAVWMDDTAATVVAYNIAEFGRYICTSHPVLVRLDNGEFMFCRPGELRPRVRQDS
ncbi:hypothetical protein [Limnobacter sp.]|uniref:hypothetical protein n=1 Tax=Limnobacter sp. TaxID=2003368 RepID=UPI003516C4E3